MKKKKVHLGVVVEPKLKESLKRVANEMDRSLNWIVVKFLEDQLDFYENSEDSEDIYPRANQAHGKGDEETMDALTN